MYKFDSDKICHNLVYISINRNDISLICVKNHQWMYPNSEFGVQHNLINHLNQQN